MKYERQLTRLVVFCLTVDCTASTGTIFPHTFNSQYKPTFYKSNTSLPLPSRQLELDRVKLIRVGRGQLSAKTDSNKVEEEHLGWLALFNIDKNRQTIPPSYEYKQTQSDYIKTTGVKLKLQ